MPLPVAGLAPEDRKARTTDLIARAATAPSDERQRLLDEVIVLNIPVARSLAGRYRNRGQPVDELEQVACLALTRAVRGFDPERGEDLLVYAVPSITGELKRHFRDHSWAVRPPRRVQELRPRLTDAEERLTQALGRAATSSELAAELDVDRLAVDEARTATELVHPISLDEPAFVGPGGATGSSLSDLLPEVDPGFAHGEAVAVLAPACRRLKARDRWILRMRFYDQLTQAEIAEQLGVTQVQVSRLLQRILGDLRRALGVSAA